MKEISVRDFSYPSFGEAVGLVDVDVFRDDTDLVLILLRDQDRHGGPSATNALERVARAVQDKILSLLHLEAKPKVWLTWSRVDKLVFKVHFEDPVGLQNPVWTHVDEEELRVILTRFHALEDFHLWVREGSIEVLPAKVTEPTHKMVEIAKALAQERNTEGLRALLRLAALGVQKSHLWYWTEPGRPIARDLEQALHPSLLRWAVMNGARLTELEPREVDLAQVPAISSPWHPDRVLKALQRAKEGWHYEPNNHHATLYAPMGVLFFTQGLHSGMLAVLQGKGTLKARVVDFGPYYEKGLHISWGPTGAVAWLRGRAFSIPEEYGLLLALGQVLWEEGIDLVGALTPVG